MRPIHTLSAIFMLAVIGCGSGPQVEVNEAAVNRNIVGEGVTLVTLKLPGMT